MVYDNIGELIGNTPIIHFNKLTAVDGASRLYGKVEYFNPSGSVKDRAALYMLDDAMRRGVVNEATTVIEATSGNTGIALAMLCAAKGLRLILTMPESMSIERRKILAIYGAELVLTPATDGIAGSVARAEELNRTIKNSFIPSQFTNLANPKAHFDTTGVEIARDLPDVKAIVTGVGSAGTINGIAKYFKQNNTGVKIIAVEPARSPLLSGGKAGAHGLQGIGANFIPKFADKTLIDEIVTVTDEEAYEYAKRLADREGLLCGITSGAATAAAVAVSKHIDGKILAVLPDTGMRYLSTKMYD